MGARSRPLPPRPPAARTLPRPAANILLSRHGTAKICDIGMARVLGNKEYLSMLSGMGTFAWRCALGVEGLQGWRSTGAELKRARPGLVADRPPAPAAACCRPALPCSAPEVLSGRRCTEKVDLYSFGVVIWEVSR